MKKTILSLSCTLLLATALLFTNKVPALRKVFSIGKREFVINYIPAKTKNELTEIQSNSSSNIIRTVKDVDRISSAYQSPLSLLSNQDLAELKHGLVVKQGIGIVSMEYKVLQEKLSQKDFEDAMKMFGFDIKDGYWGLSSSPNIVNQIRGGIYVSSSSVDGYGYICGPPGSHYCILRSYSICIGNCD